MTFAVTDGIPDNSKGAVSVRRAREAYRQALETIMMDDNPVHLKALKYRWNHTKALRLVTKDTN